MPPCYRNNSDGNLNGVSVAQQPNGYYSLKDKVFSEFALYLIYTFYLFILFSAFLLYTRILLNNYTDIHIRFGYSLFEACILAKVVLIGQHFKIGEKFTDKPLIIPILYKAAIFSLFLFILDYAEHLILGYFEGHQINYLFQQMITHAIYLKLAKAIVMFYIFILFFACIAINNRLGNNKLFTLFFVRGNEKLS